MKKINPNGSKTLYVGGIYEVDKASGGSVTRTVTYYPVAGATPALHRTAFGASVRINNTLYYILKDHPSTSPQQAAAPLRTALRLCECRYRFNWTHPRHTALLRSTPFRGHPFGEMRRTTGTIYTDKLYTGQREMAILNAAMKALTNPNPATSPGLE